MKIIVNISMALIILLASSAFAAKPKKASKKSAAQSKTVVAEQNVPAVEPKPVEPKLAEPNIPAIEPNPPKDTNQSNVTVATVNGTTITEGQIDAILNPYMEQRAGKIPENMVPQYRQQMRKRVLDQLIIEELLTQKEKQSKIDVNQTELDGEINKMIAQQNLTPDEFKALLKAYGTSFSEYEQNMRKKMMFEKLMEIEFTQKLTKPADEQAKAYYDENIQQFSEPEKIHAKHILIKPAEDTNNPEQANKEAKEKAEDILKKIKAGESFEELAKKYSACPSAKDGGDLGTQPKGTFVPEFEKAAFALKPGQVSDVVQTNFGYHIIKLIDHNDANVISFEQAKPQILTALANKEKEQIVMDYIQKIKTGADIKYVNPEDKLEPQLQMGIDNSAPVRKSDENAKRADVKEAEKGK